MTAAVRVPRTPRSVPTSIRSQGREGDIRGSAATPGSSNMVASIVRSLQQRRPVLSVFDSPPSVPDKRSQMQDEDTKTFPSDEYIKENMRMWTPVFWSCRRRSKPEKDAKWTRPYARVSNCLLPELVRKLPTSILGLVMRDLK